MEIFGSEILPLIWAGFIAMGISLYVLLDGFSLGVGILFPFAKPGEQRDLMMASVAPVWDGNQTWLVGGGAALFTAFPKAFNLLLSALYLPIMCMLIALVFRGVAFEFRFKAKRKHFWNRAFIGGSTVAAFSQGLILGTYVQGFEYADGRLLISALDFISPFSLLTAFAVVLAYALLAACWLIMKTEGEMQQIAYGWARRLLPAVVAMIGAVSCITPYLVPEIAELWFAWPHLILLSPIPLWTLGLAGWLYYLLKREQGSDVGPFATVIALYLLTLFGLGLSLWPYVVPRVFTFWDVAAPTNSLLFVMVGVLLIVPVILLYTVHAYYVFRGKVDLQSVYH
ncbi:MAG: cytochrome d ubiquinol oxidase subunit II [Oceanococcus sp.]